ncbi:class I SAM-dependent methyltransferase [Streptomyces bacillaris]|uniref:class I SAM-dependent methyltransferase n=1 Tax=Streptomyces TaxID=1883 RepID=UPI0019680224|nr:MULTISPECIES: class I SAM-dependent methyltransferase [Streptomyces]MBH0246651.1 methyltransferase domain-containing protein [Streptomyces cavourensis]
MTQPTTRTSDAPGPARAGRDAEDFEGQYVSKLVDRWDQLIDWDRRGAGEQDFFVELLREAEARRVLDVAAGTGYHAVTLAQQGFDVTAADGSAEMIAWTRRNAEGRGLSFPAVQADWRRLGEHIGGRYDAVVCLGSSLPHLFQEADRRAALAAFYEVLNPGGMLIVDHRNFDAIRRHRYSSSGNYYYCGTGANVSIAHVDGRLCRFQYDFADGSTHHLDVYPILSDELSALLIDTGFDTVQQFGDFQENYDIDAVDFVIHVARKQ